VSGTRPTKPTHTTTSASRSASLQPPPPNIETVLETSPGALAHSIKRDYATRFHMFLIVATCVAAALLVTKGLLSVGVVEMWVRYALALIVAYGTFFIGVWVWLHLSKFGRHLRAQQERNRNEFHGDAPLDFIPNINLGDGGTTAAETFVGKGGSFDGGGAAGGWDQPLSAPNLNIPYDSSGGSAPGDISLPDIGVADVGDEGGCALVIAGILLAVVLFVVFGAATYVVYQAPVILAEVVFEVLLGSRLAAGVRAVDSANWAWALFKRTWLPFVVVSTVAMGFAVYCNLYLPEVQSAGQVIERLLR